MAMARPGGAHRLRTRSAPQRGARGSRRSPQRRAQADPVQEKGGKALWAITPSAWTYISLRHQGSRAFGQRPLNGPQDSYMGPWLAGEPDVAQWTHERTHVAATPSRHQHAEQKEEGKQGSSRAEPHDANHGSSLEGRVRRWILPSPSLQEVRRAGNMLQL